MNVFTKTSKGLALLIGLIILSTIIIVSAILFALEFAASLSGLFISFMVICIILLITVFPYYFLQVWQERYNKENVGFDITKEWATFNKKTKNMSDAEKIKLAKETMNRLKSKGLRGTQLEYWEKYIKDFKK